MEKKKEYESTMFQTLLKRRKERMQMLFGRLVNSSLSSIVPIEVVNAIKPNTECADLKHVVEQMQQLGISQSSASASAIPSGSSYDSRKRQYAYGKWYLKPKDYSSLFRQRIVLPL